MPYTAWPTSTELTSALSSRGYTIPAGTTGTGYVAQAVREIEKYTGYPFLSSGASGDSYYDANGQSRLILGRWYDEITAVATGYVEGISAGTALTVGSEYRLLKTREGKTWGIDFQNELFGGSDSIVVTGKSGWDTEIPEDAWEAVLNFAVALAVDDLKLTSGTVSEVKQENLSLKFAATVEPHKVMAAARDRLKAAAAPYRIFSF